jgi:hypothetical protein
MGAVITGQAIPTRSGVTLLARVVGNAGVPITQATLSTLEYALTNLGSPPGVSVTTGTLTALTISSAIFDQLQQSDPRWTRDSETSPGVDGLWGYNFRATLAASLFTSNSRQHVDIVFTPLTGEPFRQTFEWTPLATYA